MCGITGYIHTDQNRVVDSSTIIQMLEVQRHRGPDDSGVCVFSLNQGKSEEIPVDRVCSIECEFEGVIGFNRLSILDLSINGHQPMRSPDGKVLLTLNGEVYNAFDYKKELEDWGYTFKSTTDTEVVLALYLKYGLVGMLERLNGMFAIVIIDLGTKKAFLARDRFGIKPMYYCCKNGFFAFSSELKSFKSLSGLNFELNESKLHEFLLFRNNLHGTLLKDIESLKPGTYLSFSHSDQISISEFHSTEDFQRNPDRSLRLEDFEEGVLKELEASVQRQLLSDVKLGCQLSGGIDSSLVTWLANNNSSRGSFESVSVVFKNRAYSEEQYIDQVSKNLDITSHKFLLESDYYLDNLECATWHLEVPINHPNTIGIFRLSQRAKEYVTVLLSGEGADEVFGGYNRFHTIQYPYTPGKILRELKRSINDPNQLSRYLNSDYRSILANAFMTGHHAAELLPNFSFALATHDRGSLYESLSGSRFDRQVKFELNTYIPDLLIRQDKMSMAHSIENRVPFLDNKLVDYSFEIPEKHLIPRSVSGRRNTEKYLLKRVTAKRFGNQFAFRDKMGFGIPLREYFSEKRFSDYIYDTILPSVKNRKLFNYSLVENWAYNVQRLGASQLEALWIMISFEVWAIKYLD